jgi:hypothetical protein
MDADVSGFIGTSTPSTLWDTDDLAGYDSTNKLTFLYDADSPSVVGDDTGNPDPVTGILRSPGYIGARMLYADSAHFVGKYTGKPTMATPSYRNFEPLTAQAQYEFVAKGGITPAITVVRDYRAIMGIGPYTINAGDSIHIVIAWVIGPGKQGIVKNSQVAQSMFDGSFSARRSNVLGCTDNIQQCAGALAPLEAQRRVEPRPADPRSGFCRIRCISDLAPGRRRQCHLGHACNLCEEQYGGQDERLSLVWTSFPEDLAATDSGPGD